MGIDLQKSLRLAEELATELEAQGQIDGDLGDTLRQFISEGPELVALNPDHDLKEER